MFSICILGIRPEAMQGAPKSEGGGGGGGF